MSALQFETLDKDHPLLCARYFIVRGFNSNQVDTACFDDIKQIYEYAENHQYDFYDDLQIVSMEEKSPVLYKDFLTTNLVLYNNKLTVDFTRQILEKGFDLREIGGSGYSFSIEVHSDNKEELKNLEKMFKEMDSSSSIQTYPYRGISSLSPRSVNSSPLTPGGGERFPRLTPIDSKTLSPLNM